MTFREAYQKQKRDFYFFGLQILFREG